MPFTIACPHCQKPLNVPDSAVGKTVRCPACQNTFVIAPPPTPVPEAGSVSAGAPPVSTPPPAAPPPYSAPPTSSSGSAPAWEKDSLSSRRRREEEEAEAERERKRRRQREREEEEEEEDERRRRDDAANPFKLGREERQGYRVPHRGGQLITFGILAMMLGCCPIFGLAMSIATISMASNDLQQIQMRRMDPSGQGMTQTAQILGYLGIVFAVLGFILGVALNLGGRIR